jgi:hypothetical protein
MAYCAWRVWHPKVSYIPLDLCGLQ